MAAGGGSGRSASSGGLESSLDRRFQGVTNTMESIQSLSGWCIENKKYHTLIVRYWMKWLKKSEASHRLNLFYLANDVIQNCKRKNAIIYRSTFADVLPEAALLVRDPSVRKSVERIFTIWEERNVYPEELISELKVGLGKKEAQIAVNPKAVLKSKIVAEFAPQTFIDQLAAYKRSVEDIELKEKQLSSMRVDVCSTETLKRLKDKAGGKKFSKDFEDGSAKLEEFVSFLDKQVKHGPRIIEALENADIFYEAQYKEVKIVANAYKTFANRVNNLKKKLDQLKTSLPDPEESPIPSPSMDAPSPTGSESPFHGMDDSEPSVRAEEKEVDEAPAGDLSSKSSSPKPTEDNCDVEDMELSDDEGNESSHIIESRKEKSESASVTTASPVLKPVETISKSAAQPAVQSPAKTPGNPPPFAFNPLPNLANVDLGKISSILSSLTSVMKNTGVSPVSRPSPGTPTTPKDLTSGLKTSTQAPATSSANSLASILSKVDISPESILSVLSKTQTQTGTGLQGLSSLLQSVAGNSSFQSNTHTVTPSSTKESCVPSTSALGPAQSLTASRNLEGFHSNSPASEVSSTSANKLPAAQNLGVSGSGSKHTQQANCSSSYLGKEGKEQPAEQEQESSLSSASSPTSLELKIHKFLQVNPSFNALNLNIPILGSSINNPVSESQSSNSDYHHSQHRIPTSTSVDNVDGTPVRDERGSTPTQDEIMDKPSASGSMVDPMSLLSKILSPGSSSTPSSTRSPLQGRESSYLADMKQNSSSAASTTTTASSYRPFKQGELSPTSYRGQSDGWEKPSSLTNPDSSPSEKFYPDTSFQDDDDYHTSGYEYGGPPPSALFNLDKKPSKSILKLSNKTQQTFSEVKDYAKKPPPALVGDNFNRDTEGKFSQHQELGNYNSNTMNSRSSPSRVVHSHGFGRSSEVVAPEETPSPKPGESNFFTSSANHNKHFGSASKLQQYVDSSPLSASGNHMVSGVGVGSSSSRTDLTQQITLSAPVSATSTIEFKNMLKNASSSRKSSDGDFPGHHHLGASDRDRENRNSTTVTEGDVGAGFVNSDQQQIEEEHYRIETLVSSSSSDHLPDSTVGKGAPIETLGYSNRRMSGERIQTVESIRVIGKGVRGHSRDALAPPRGTAGWFEGGDHYHDGTGASLTSGISSDLPGSTIGLGSPAAPPTSLSSAATSLPSAPHSSNQPLSLSNFGNQYDDRRSLTLQPPPFPEASVPSFFSKTHPPPPIPQPPPPPSSLDFVVSKQGNPNSKGPGGIMGIVDHSLSFPPRDPIMTLGGNTATIGGVNVVPPSPNSFPPPLTAAQDGLPPPASLPPPPLLNPSLPPLLGDHGPLSATLPPFKDHCGPAPQPGTVKEHFGPLSGLPPPPDARDLVAGGSGPPNKDLPPHHHQSGGPTPIQGHVQKNLSGGGPPSLSNPLSPPASNSVSASSQKQTSNATSLCHDLHGVAHNLPPPPQQGPGQHPIPPPPSQLQQDHGIRPLLPPLPHKPMAPLYPSPHPPQMPMGPFFRPPRPDFRPREHHFNARESFRGAKRPRMSYGSGDRGGGGNPFFAPRRPFFPPRY
ncbi:regulation of nuclear pre-mRNA domain-containing protein 2-like isoform X2 [Polypterus senegalus]|uniref:regulation of nuclear pre-mRNA domain-containing protein 2-like isoform X2 n=1 Tax=Polypterus senegalus TaxID=55291 RepID=UPI0019626E0D|nr:regulation of nuclear pre-mRNA domain-containing protein 2-like isoform X2 [Polypterus senegalus]